MKVTINSDGEVTLDITNGDGQAALDLIHALQGDVKRQKSAEERREVHRQAAAKVDGSPLNVLQYRTWEYLCGNDCNDGIHVSSVGKAFGITNSAANTRLVALTNLGYAKRVHRGYYRAIIPE